MCFPIQWSRILIHQTRFLQTNFPGIVFHFFREISDAMCMVFHLFFNANPLMFHFSFLNNAAVISIRRCWKDWLSIDYSSWTNKSIHRRNHGNTSGSVICKKAIESFSLHPMFCFGFAQLLFQRSFLYPSKVAFSESMAF